VSYFTSDSLAICERSMLNVGMSTLMDRIRDRRNADRRSRAIAKALRAAPSEAMRRELLEIASRF
jgi:hypothetical protein